MKLKETTEEIKNKKPEIKPEKINPMESMDDVSGYYYALERKKEKKPELSKSNKENIKSEEAKINLNSENFDKLSEANKKYIKKQLEKTKVAEEAKEISMDDLSSYIDAITGKGPK